MLPSRFSPPPPALYPLGHTQRHVAVNLEVIVCTGVLHSCTFPKLAGSEVMLSCTRLSPFTMLCLKHFFVFLLASIRVRRIVVNDGCQVLQGHTIENFVLDILESLYFYNFLFLHQMSDVSFSCLMFGIIMWLFFCKY